MNMTLSLLSHIWSLYEICTIELYQRIHIPENKLLRYFATKCFESNPAEIFTTFKNGI